MNVKKIKPSSNTQRRFILAKWHSIKLKDDTETLFKLIANIVKRPVEDFGYLDPNNEDKLLYDYKGLNLLNSTEAYKVAQGFINIEKQNADRGVNTKIKQGRSEFARPCKYCKEPIYWGVAGNNERIPIEIINGVETWHKCQINN